MPKQDYYQVLEIEPEADPSLIKESYRKLAFEYHPDRNRENPRASEKMKQLNEAYAVLSDPDKRSRYDMLRNQFGSAAHERFRQAYSDQDIFRGTDIHKVFEEMAKVYGIRGFEEVFREFYGQGKGPLRYSQSGTRMRGFVFNFPPGKNNSGQQNFMTGTAGRLIAYLLKQFGNIDLPEDGADINDTISLAPEIAKTGGPYAYYHRMHSKKLIVQIPPEVKNGQRIRLPGQGHQGKFGGQKGDLFLKIRIQKPLLARLKAFLTGN